MLAHRCPWSRELERHSIKSPQSPFSGSRLTARWRGGFHANPLVARIVHHLRQRPQILCLAALVGLASALRGPAPPPATEAGVAALLGEATHTHVAADAFVWDRSRGRWLDAFWGRDVLFLGRARADGPRDVYRATVRVSREGRPVAVRAAWNLSQTPVADESALEAHNRHIAYVLNAHGAVQAITVLAPQRDGSAWSRLVAALSGFWQHGRFGASARTEVAFEQPPPSARIQLRPSAQDGGTLLVMALGDPPQPAAVALASGELVTDPDDRYGVRSWRVPARGEPIAAEALSPLAPSPLPALDDGLGWPPEGSWHAALDEQNPRLYRTALQIDGATITLVAIDTRRLSLGLVAGFDAPRPSTGARPSGQLPEGIDALARFNGVGDHDGGLVVNRRLLLPPREGEATVAIDREGLIRMGAWHDAVDETPTSLRQAGAPLVRQGRVSGGDGGMASRSALCRTRDGYLIYAASEAVSEATLARALVGAACDHALALSEEAGMVAGGKLIAGHARPREPSPADAFYLSPRELTPSLGDLPWKPDGGAQPPPTWMPAAFAAEVTLLGTTVKLHAIAADRYRWEIRPGERERAGKTAERALEPAELARAHIAISLGIGWRKDNRRGLVLDGVIALPIRPDLGVISAGTAGQLAIRRSLEDLAPRGDASELPLLAEGGRIRSEAKRLGARHRRGAACLLSDRTLLVAVSEFDSAEPNTTALLDLGCARIVELNRGKQIQAFVHRAGSDEAPRASYDETVLYGMSGRADGHARPLSD